MYEYLIHYANNTALISHSHVIEDSVRATPEELRKNLEVLERSLDEISSDKNALQKHINPCKLSLKLSTWAFWVCYFALKNTFYILFAINFWWFNIFFLPIESTESIDDIK